MSKYLDATPFRAPEDWSRFNEAVDILNHTRTQTVIDATGLSRVYYGDFHVFSGVGTVPAVFP